MGDVVLDVLAYDGSLGGIESFAFEALVDVITSLLALLTDGIEFFEEMHGRELEHIVCLLFSSEELG